MAFLSNGVPIIGGGEPRYSIPANTTSGGWWTYNSSWNTYQHSTYSQGGTSASGFTIPNGVRKIFVDIDDFRYHENASGSTGNSGRIAFQLQNSSGVGFGGDVYNAGEGSYEGQYALESQRPPDGIGGYQPLQFGNGELSSQMRDGAAIPMYFAGKTYATSTGIGLLTEAVFHHYRIELTRLTTRTNGDFNNTSNARWHIRWDGWNGHGGASGGQVYGGQTYNSVQRPSVEYYHQIGDAYCHSFPGGHVGGLLFRGQYNNADRFEMNIEVSYTF
jgi:hypothetical protein|tara:strand:+ start:2103 stop:2924 length:822 start_codon:yes stop_codon:yes gene_type:complete